MPSRFNPPANWPTPPAGWTPPPGWQPDPAWGPVPAGHQLWVDDKVVLNQTPAALAWGQPAATAVVTSGTKSWVRRHKLLTSVVGIVVLLVAAGAMGDNDKGSKSTQLGLADSPSNSRPVTPDASVTETPTPEATDSVTPTQVAVPTTAPVVETKTATSLAVIPFRSTTVRDSSLKKGVTTIRTRGRNGTRRLTYQVTYTNGVQTSRKLVRSVVVTQPVTQVTVIGTKVAAQPASQCDPNYTGACVPIASDVDCAGGSGNGPAYVEGPVYVVGVDIYDLDRDGDGVGCE